MSSSVSGRGAVLAGLAGVAGEYSGALGFDLAGPFGDGLGVGSGVEGGLVAGEPGVTAGDERLGVLAGPGEPGGAGPGSWAACISRMVCSSRCGAKMISSNLSMAGSTSASRR